VVCLVLLTITLFAAALAHGVLLAIWFRYTEYGVTVTGGNLHSLLEESGRQRLKEGLICS
jgi:hypothetical protein